MDIEIQLLEFCNKRLISQEEFEAAQDYMHSLSADPKAWPSEVLKDTVLIEKVKELVGSLQHA